MARKKPDGKNVICPTCWAGGMRSVMKAEPVKQKQPESGDRFPTSVSVWTASYLCKCGKTWKE